MKRFVLASSSALGLATFWALGAYAASLAVGKKIEVIVDPMNMEQERAELWKKFGGFCSIKDWHPGVANCEESKDGSDTVRTLTLNDGGIVKEKLLESVDGRYKYAVISSPWPVKNYEAQFALTPDDDDENEINFAWSAVFDPEGASDKDARKMVDGVIKAGMDNLKTMTAKPGAKDND